MIVRNVTRQQVIDAVNHASDNILLDIAPEGKGWRFTLRPRSSKGQYGRRSYTGRRVHAVCYHGHHIVMQWLFRAAPDAVLISAHARYDGVADFYRLADSVGDRNIGSIMQPMLYREACDCYK